MMRIEVVANRSVEENLLDAFREEGVAKFYTKYPAVLGIGSSGPRMGDAIWPEENFVLVVWCEDEEVYGIEKAIVTVKKQFPDEGIKFFKLLSSTQDSPSTPAIVSMPIVKKEVTPASVEKIHTTPIPVHTESSPAVFPSVSEKKEKPILLPLSHSKPSRSYEVLGPESENY